jgi:hypothetical protein
MSNPDAALVNHFESLGRGCEFGFLQRRAGAEPMGLLRFASMPLEGLIRGLQSQFAGIGDADSLALSRNDGEYWIEVPKFALRYHTELYEGEITPEELVQLERRKVKFLAAGLIDGLKSGSKIFVYLQRQPVTDGEFDTLRTALASCGPATLLWVAASDRTHPADTVELLDERLMVGYLGRLAPRQALYDVDYASWMAICRRAFDLWSAGQSARGRDDDLDGLVSEIVFGSRGNSAAYLGGGWAPAEAAHTWAIGNRSELALPLQSEPGDLLLKLIVGPFVSPPAVPVQRLAVLANDVEIAHFSLTKEANLQCLIPASNLQGRDRVDLTFLHPDAARPARVVPGHADRRNLTIAFHRIVLQRVRASA